MAGDWSFCHWRPHSPAGGSQGCICGRVCLGRNSDGPCHPASVQETGCPMPTRVYLGTLGAEGQDPWKLTHRFLP